MRRNEKQRHERARHKDRIEPPVIEVELYISTQGVRYDDSAQPKEKHSIKQKQKQMIQSVNPLSGKYRYSVARLFLIKRIEETKYIPMISERNRTTLLEDPLPTLETAKKNCTNQSNYLI